MKDCYRLGPHAGLCPNPKFPLPFTSQSLPFPLFTPHPLKSLALGDLQAICPIWVPGAIPERCCPGTTEPELLPALRSGKHSEPNAHCSQQNFHELWAVCQRLSCSLTSVKQAPAGGQLLQKLGGPQVMEGGSFLCFRLVLLLF